MLKFNEISKSFKNDFWAKPFWALDQFSFHIKEGELTGFLGANGAGKTTAIKILMGFISQNSGSIEFGKNLGTKQKEILSNIGYVPERPYFYPHLTGREFMEYMGKLNEISSLEIKKKIKHWSERLSIDHALDRKVRKYSKGMLQRLGFTSSLIHDPKMLILDEPLSGLDPVGRKDFKDALLELNHDGKTIFFSSHIVSDVEEICKKVVVIDHGKHIYEGPINDIIESNLKDSYRASFEQDGEQHIVEIPSADKDIKLKELVECGAKINSLERNRPTLEQVIYKIKK